MSCHEMNLAPEPFSLIADGKKKFELRLNDEKRQGIRGGDTIIFTNRKDPQKRVLCHVTDIFHFPDFASSKRTFVSPFHLRIRNISSKDSGYCIH